MPLIQNPNIVRKLFRKLRLTALPDGVLAPEIVGVIVLEDLSAPLNEEERGCRGAVQASNVAAENSIITLVRVGAPATYDLEVTRIFFSTATTGEIRVIVPTLGLSGIVASNDKTFSDQKLPGQPASQLGVINQVGLPAGRNIWRGTVLANTPIMLDVNIRIGTIGQADELTSIIIGAVTVNVTVRGGFQWTEAAPLG